MSDIEDTVQSYVRQLTVAMQGQSSTITTLGGNVTELHSAVAALGQRADGQDRATESLRLEANVAGRELQVMAYKVTTIAGDGQRQMITNAHHAARLTALEATGKALADPQSTREEQFMIRLDNLETRNEMLTEKLDSQISGGAAQLHTQTKTLSITSTPRIFRLEYSDSVSSACSASRRGASPVAQPHPHNSRTASGQKHLSLQQKK